MRLVTLAAAAALVVSSLSAAVAADHKVTIKGFRFEPAALSLAVGDTVTFTNEDSAPHTATAGDGAFDTGRLGKGQSATVTVSAAGQHDYTCLIHPMMKGTVTAK